MAREERDQRRRAFGNEGGRRKLDRGLPDGEPVRRPTPLPDGAHRRLSRGQIVGLAILLALLLLLATFRTRRRWKAFICCSSSASWAIRRSSWSPPSRPRGIDAATPLPDEALPAYTIIVPLYREAAVAAELVANLARLDYPRDRLQVLIVLEANDHETQAAFQALDLPPVSRC
jgi:hypothetical protein